MDKELFEVLIKNNVRDRMDIAIVNNKITDVANASAKGFKATSTSLRLIRASLICSGIAILLLSKSVEEQAKRISILEKKLAENEVTEKEE